MRVFHLLWSLILICSGLGGAVAQTAPKNGSFTLYLTQADQPVFAVPNDGMRSNVFLLHIPSGRSYSTNLSGEKGPHFKDLESGAYAFEVEMSDFGFSSPGDARYKRARHTRYMAGYFWLAPGEQKVRKESWDSLGFYVSDNSAWDLFEPAPQSFYKDHAEGICGVIPSNRVSQSAKQVHFNILRANAAESLTRSRTLAAEAETVFKKQEIAIRQKLSPRGRALLNMALAVDPEASNQVIDTVFGTGKICLQNEFYGDQVRECRKDAEQFGRFGSPVRNLLGAMEDYISPFVEMDAHAARVREACQNIKPRDDLSVTLISEPEGEKICGPPGTVPAGDAENPMDCVTGEERFRWMVDVRRHQMGADTRINPKQIRIWMARPQTFGIGPRGFGLTFDQEQGKVKYFGVNPDPNSNNRCAASAPDFGFYAIGLDVGMGPRYPAGCSEIEYTFSDSGLSFAVDLPADPAVTCMAGSQLFIEVVPDSSEDNTENNRLEVDYCKAFEREANEKLTKIEFVRTSGTDGAPEGRLKTDDQVKVRLTFDQTLDADTKSVQVRAFSRISTVQTEGGRLLDQGQFQPIGLKTVAAAQTSNEAVYETEPILVSSLVPFGALTTGDQVRAYWAAGDRDDPHASQDIWGDPARILEFSLVDENDQTLREIKIDDAFYLTALFDGPPEELFIDGTVRVEATNVEPSFLAPFNLSNELRVSLKRTQDRKRYRSDPVTLHERDDPRATRVLVASPKDLLAATLLDKAARASILDGEAADDEGGLTVIAKDYTGRSYDVAYTLEKDFRSITAVANRKINLKPGTYKINVPIGFNYTDQVSIDADSDLELEIKPVGLLRFDQSRLSEPELIIVTRQNTNDQHWQRIATLRSDRSIQLPPGDYRWDWRIRDPEPPRVLIDQTFTVKAGEVSRVLLRRVEQ